MWFFMYQSKIWSFGYPTLNCLEGEQFDIFEKKLQFMKTTRKFSFSIKYPKKLEEKVEEVRLSI